MSELETELARWLALDQHFGQSDQGMAARLVRELAADRDHFLRRVHALETALHPLVVSDIDTAEQVEEP